ncbi:helix-turn-helix domain-containing protein [Desulfobacula phenolica]|uniref:Transcriptional regulator, XRE family with cupin sensor n=1 Tax=Desulfobacula phenolica TaxID=90732 RepID=A0A1H2K9X6_9BACT|nr:cupin domain-containing protein [Desulfobacula phenolica]SDU65520.1 transcriptional regulator, XRE family with cupin sensor [Desulfobacula phenolica]
MSNLLKKLSQKLKEFRISKGLDQQTLAQRSGLARSYISLIESGKKTAAVSTLALIADALGVGVGEFFEDTKNFRNPKIAANKNIELKPVAQKNSYGYTYTPLSIEKKNKIMDPFLVRIEPDSKQRYDFSHKGEEFNYILQGKLKLLYKGDEIILEKGDCVYFDSSVPHKLELIGDETVYMLSINATGIKKQEEK